VLRCSRRGGLRNKPPATDLLDRTSLSSRFTLSRKGDISVAQSDSPSENSFVSQEYGIKVESYLKNW